MKESIVNCQYMVCVPGSKAGWGFVNENLSLQEWCLMWSGFLPCRQRTSIVPVSDIDKEGNDCTSYFVEIVVQENWPRDFWGTP